MSLVFISMFCTLCVYPASMLRFYSTNIAYKNFTISAIKENNKVSDAAKGTSVHGVGDEAPGDYPEAVLLELLYPLVHPAAVRELDNDNVDFFATN